MFRTRNHVDQLKAAVLIEAKWNSDEYDVSKPRSFKRHMSKSTKPHTSFYNNNFNYLVCLGTKEKYTTSITKNYAARYYIQGIEDMIPDRWRSDDKEYEFIYVDLSRLSLNDVEDITAGHRIQKLKEEDWTEKDVKRNQKMIDKTLKRREQLKRLEEYVRGRPKNVNPSTFVKPM
ncbi:hypothetical protein Tco_0223799 [Tanacetum coccineum]